MGFFSGNFALVYTFLIAMQFRTIGGLVDAYELPQFRA